MVDSIPKTKGFKVDSDSLVDVADAVKRLLEDVATNNYPGNLQHFTEHGKGTMLTDQKTGLGVLYGTKTNPFAETYDDVYNGVLTTFNSMKQQLTNLESTCRTTAQQYQHHEDDVKKNVTQSGEIGD